jgi:hypothetical protein
MSEKLAEAMTYKKLGAILKQEVIVDKNAWAVAYACRGNI